jgi:hypothetical protein
MASKNKHPETIAFENDPFFEETPGPLAIAEPTVTSIRAVNLGVVLHAGGGLPVTRMKLAQATSGQGTPGHFVASDGSEERPELVMVPVRVQAIRTLWSEGVFQRGRGPECASLDGVRPVEFLPNGDRALYAGSLCAECPMYVSQPWRVEQGARFCAPGYDILGLSLETLEVISLRLTGTSSKIAKVLGRPGVFARQQVRLFAKKQVAQQGTLLQIFAEPLGPVDEEQIHAVEEALRAFNHEEVAA